MLRRTTIFSLVLGGLICLGCKAEDTSPTPSRYSYLALGDSYTIGEGIPRTSNFPAQLTNTLLLDRDIRLNPTLTIAQTGWRTDNLLQGIALNSNLAPPYDLVTILIGVNDQFQGVDTITFLDNLKEVFNRGESLALEGPNSILVLSIPDWSATPFASGRDTISIRKQINKFNAIVKREALRNGYFYINITAISREARQDQSLLAEDGLHPSAKMYARWVDEVLPIVTVILE